MLKFIYLFFFNFQYKLLLHHVVPGAFKVADLMAGDEMTGVSLAGTQLRANLYARQLYDNRWNDIEVIMKIKTTVKLIYRIELDN